MSKKIGLDIHGVIDQDPAFFSWLTRRLRGDGWEVHVITGGRWTHNEQKLKAWNIEFDKFFSITDYHISAGTPLTKDCPDGHICVADNLWDNVKGKYCYHHAISVMVDDSLHYSKYMPNFTHFEYWGS